MTAPIMSGADPVCARRTPRRAGAPRLHRQPPNRCARLAEALAKAGLAVELPPARTRHGLADVLPTQWGDWSSAAGAACRSLAERCQKVVVAGLPGGHPDLWLAEHHTEVGGIAVVNPLILAPEQADREAIGARWRRAPTCSTPSARTSARRGWRRWPSGRAPPAAASPCSRRPTSGPPPRRHPLSDPVVSNTGGLAFAGLLARLLSYACTNYKVPLYF